MNGHKNAVKQIKEISDSFTTQTAEALCNLGLIISFDQIIHRPDLNSWSDAY